MIIKGLFNLIYAFLNVVLTPFQIVPNVPSLFRTIVNYNNKRYSNLNKIYIS